MRVVWPKRLKLKNINPRNKWLRSLRNTFVFSLFQLQVVTYPFCLAAKLAEPLSTNQTRVLVPGCLPAPHTPTSTPATTEGGECILVGPHEGRKKELPKSFLYGASKSAQILLPFFFFSSSFHFKTMYVYYTLAEKDRPIQKS